MTLLPFIVLIGAMFLMTRSAKNKQRQAAQMRDQMGPGTGVRTIGGMYATVKEVHEDAVLLEVAPGVHAFYAKNAVGAVLDDAEYNRIVHGIDPEDTDAAADLDTDDAADDTPVVPDDASSLTEAEDETADTEAADEDKKTDLSKPSAAADAPKEDKRDDDADAK
ncbi:preprotein translocase subunit YajC [Streptomyces sp. NBS 14/10]|uniref:preprotein translocase subunit YajC n=1 Tax=Streptomyces sp. NBS 14/10 TaxID=1945643 RepID=UPI000B7C89F1|nr:preprotein translocase subunit YajC [Streptomyces sp. NBS 14/10]KAK1186363.1 preprotein translocase subunit YajC [Streptomyces sp. NBS 14/10]